MPGTIIEVDKNTFKVLCANNSFLTISRVKPEGKKEMSVHDFLLGNPMKAGEVLG